MVKESSFENSPPREHGGNDLTDLTCGLLQLLGFRNSVGRTIKTGAYVRLSSKGHEEICSKKSTDSGFSDGNSTFSVTKKGHFFFFQKKEKEKVLRTSSFRRNIKAWIKKRISRKGNKKQIASPGSPCLSRTNSINRSASKSKSSQPKENVKEFGRTLLDGILHRIPYGEKVPEEMIKGSKLFRSLSADHDSYSTNEKRSQDKKYQRNYSSPAMVYEIKSIDAIEDLKEEEESLEDKSNELEEEKVRIDNHLEIDVEDIENKVEGMTLFGDENMVWEGLVSKDEGNLLVETDSEAQIEEKIEIDLESKDEEKTVVDLGSEIEEKSEMGLQSDTEENSQMDLGSEAEVDLKSEIDLKSEVDFYSEEKHTCLTPKGIESVSNLLEQLGLDLDMTKTHIKEKDELPILDSDTNLKEFTKVWDQVNKIEFEKFDCNLIPFDLILVLDIIDEMYKEVYTNPSTSVHWFLNYKSKLDSKSIGRIILKEVQERVTWHLSAEKECSDEADDIIGWDLMRYDEWFEFRNDVNENIVDELEKLILDDLIDDLVVEPSR